MCGFARLVNMRIFASVLPVKVYWIRMVRENACGVVF